MKAVLHHLRQPLLALALLPASVLAQADGPGDLQQRMSAEQFRAAGLHKLEAGELATLNAWLSGTLEQTRAQEREQALEEGRQEVIGKNRGFLTFNSSEPITATLADGFPGFARGRQFTLDNGQVWEQTDDERLPARSQPTPVRITPGVAGVWYMQAGSLNTRAKVRRIK